MARVSVVINTCNEAHYLNDCIASARPLADELVVCDMESTDGSAELAGSLGCEVIRCNRTAAPEPDARIAAIEAASGDWILVLDPDMRLRPETCRRLREIAEAGEADMVDFYCVNLYLGTRSNRGHASQPVFRKFFRKSAFRPNRSSIQTFWHDSLSGRCLRLGREHAIEHLAYRSTCQLVETLGRYARQEACDAYARGVPPSVARMLLRPLKRFLGNYVLRLGFLDGAPGLIVSASVSGYLFLIEAHLWDLWRYARTGDRTPS